MVKTVTTIKVRVKAEMYRTSAQPKIKFTQDTFALSAAITIFTSAFLLFQVQPIISKVILPWFGGSPMVWSTCLLFFQSVLLLGYGYAHVLTKLAPNRQAGIHIILLVLACGFLPITPETLWQPQGDSSPTWHILRLLTAHVGLPYFLLSATAPLVQVWYSRVYQDRSPYRLYALSNFSSMLALLSYPFIVEPLLDAPTQGYYWSLAFLPFAIFISYLAIRMMRSIGISNTHISSYDSHLHDSHLHDSHLHDSHLHKDKLSDFPPHFKQKILWLLLPACASLTLLAITNHLSQDVAVIPFLWIVPLCLYLLSFILCFDNPRWYRRGIISAATVLLTLILSIISLGEVPFLDTSDYFHIPDLSWNLRFEFGIYISLLFLVCMLCHGELTRQKPSPAHLSSFYLFMSAGSAMGAAFVCLICPLIFSTYMELPIGLVSAFIISLIVLRDLWTRFMQHRSSWLGVIPLSMALFSFIIVARGQSSMVEPGNITSERSFYGVLSVDDLGVGSPYNYRRTLYHGRILHGMQVRVAGKETVPTKYFSENSGIGITMRHYVAEGSTVSAPRRVGIVGLGIGSLLGYSRSQDIYRFYEINAQVIELAKKYFSFIQTSPAKLDIVLGDARLSLAKEVPQNFDILVLDAFSGDAIPIHLLTVEAFDLYLHHLRDGGVIAMHLSNRHLDLSPIAAGLAERNQMKAMEVYLPDTGHRFDTTSTWVLITNNNTFINNPAVQDAAALGRKQFDPVRPWTDQYSSLLDVIP